MKERCFGRAQALLCAASRGETYVAAGLVVAVALCLARPAAAAPEADATAKPAEAAVTSTEPAKDAAKDPPAKSDDGPPSRDQKDQSKNQLKLPFTSRTDAVPDARSHYRALIEKEAAGTGLAPEIAEAVMGVESGYNASVIGGVGEIGLMQLLPSTARMLGFTGSLAELAIPENNVHYGVMYLAQAWRLAGGDLCTAVMKYRAGHGEIRFSYLSVNYCVAVRARLAARGFRVTGTVPVATFGEPMRSGGVGGGGCGRKCVGVARIGRVDLVALNTRLNALVVQVRAGK
ncbi:transglycosylase SLT domain-containing protein [Bradyrhizobium genosp. L]|nr:transglycosylase SLT domain-containing protein [Bradyrhizobium genosp. L]